MADEAPDVLTGPASKASDRAPDVLEPSAGRERRVLENEPDDTLISSSAKAVPTTVIKGLSHIPGMFGDIRDLGKYAVRGAHSVVSGRPFADVWREGEENEQKLREGAKGSAVGRAFRGMPQAPSGEDISAPILERTGEYKPTSMPGRWGMVAGEAGLSALSPAGGIRTVAGAATSPSVAAATRILKQNAISGVPLGAVGGGAGAAVGELTDNPGAGLIASFAAPTAATLLSHPVRAYAAPVAKGNQRAQAAERMVNTTTEPQAALAKLETPQLEVLPGSKPTTAQVTGDVGQAQAEKLGTMHDPNFAAAITDKIGEQNQARVGTLRTLASPDADPTEVSKAFQRHLEAIDALHSSKVAQASGEAEQLAGRIPQTVPAEASGEQLRGAAEQHKTVIRGMLKKLYDSVDPDGTMNIVASSIPQATAKIVKNVNPDVSIESAIAKPVLEMATRMREVMPFRDVVSFDQTITDAMKRAAKADDWTGHGQLGELKGAVKKSINEALKNQHAWEQQALARGDIRQEDMLAHNLQRSIDEWRQARMSGAGAGASAGRPDTAGATALAAPGGGGGPVAGGPALSGITPTVPREPTPNFDPDSAQRLALANKGYGAFKDQYAPIDPMLQKRPMGGEYTKNASAVPADAFRAGDQGYERAQQWMRGANNSPDAIGAYQDIATSRLREAMKGDTLAPADLARWKTRYGPALRAIDEISPGFSARFDDAASATATLAQVQDTQKTAMREAQKGAAAKFLGLEHPDDVTALVGRAMSADDSGRQISQLVDRVSQTGDPAGLEGLKKAAVDWMTGDLATARIGTGNEAMISGAQMMAFVRNNPSAVRALFGDEGLVTAQRVADDLRRAQRVISNYSTTPGSDTARYLSPLLQAAQQGEHSLAMTLPMIAWAAWQEHGIKGLMTVGSAAMAKNVVEAIRNKGLASINRIYLEALANPEVGKALLKEGLDAKGQVNDANLRALFRAIQMGEAAGRREDDKREGRATGGAVKMDHDREADRLIREAMRARKGAGTEPLLNQPDEAIVRALAIAGARSEGGPL